MFFNIEIKKFLIIYIETECFTTFKEIFRFVLFKLICYLIIVHSMQAVNITHWQAYLRT